MKKLFFLFLFPFIICMQLQAQQHFFGGAQLEYGRFFRNYAQKRDVLRTRGLGSVLATNLTFQYRLWNTISLEAGAGLKRFRWRLKDHDFANRFSGFEMEGKSVNRFLHYFGSIQYANRINNKTYWYLQIGYHFDFVGKDSLEESRAFSIGNEDLTIKSSFIENTYSIFPEVGIQWFDLNDNLWSAGLKYNMILGDNMQTVRYKVMDNNALVSEDKGILSGSYISMVLKYHFLLAHKQKKERKPKKSRNTKNPIVVKDSIVEQPDTVVINNDKINDRDLVTLHKIRVTSPNLTIKVYDHQIVDGDIISLFLNDEWILEEYTLQKSKYEIKVTIKEGQSKLILYALNLGKYRPNTAAIVIDDGHKEQQVILESNLEESGTLEIKYNP